MKLSHIVLDVLIFVKILVFLCLCPYTKVEESFNVQATHDLLFHSSNLTAFDHHEYPGVVPRTFVGPIILSTIAKPILFLGGSLFFEKGYSLYLIRIILALIFAFIHAKFRQSILDRYGDVIARNYGLLILSQFHLLFYSSRPLPNTFALCLVVLSFSFWVEKKYLKMFFVLGITASLFRSELFALILPIALWCVLSGQVNVFSGILVGICSIAFGAGFSILVDTYFWKRVLWAEGEVFFFNTVLNKSSEWGVYSWHWYFSNAIPKALLGSLVFIPFGIVGKREIRSYFFCALAFVGLYSFLPHKEIRFIFYAIPLFTLTAAAGLTNLASKHIFFKLISYLIVVVTFVGSLFFILASYHNYYGAEALNTLYKMNATEKSFHMDAHITMNGVSRFCEKVGWKGSKREDFHDFSQYAYLLTGEPEKHRVHFDVVKSIRGYSKFDLKNFKILTEPKAYILEKIKRNETHLDAVVYWYQTLDRVHLTYNLQNVMDYKVVTDSYGLRLDAVSKNQKYQSDLVFADWIDPNVTVSVMTRYIKVSIIKKEAKPWKRLVAWPKSPPYVKMDWDHQLELKSEQKEKVEVPKFRYPPQLNVLNRISTFFTPGEFSIIVFLVILAWLMMMINGSRDRIKIE
jgi:alpha-1,6-mannosyltransferase